MRKSVLLTGFAAVVLAATFILFYPVSDNPPVCFPPPFPVFYLMNDDMNQSHSVYVTVKNTSEYTVARESYRLDPGEEIRSEYHISDDSGSLYTLQFIVDNRSTSTIPVTLFYHQIPQLRIDPGLEKVVFNYYALNGDYGCNLSKR